MTEVVIHNKLFTRYKSKRQIQRKVKQIAKEVNSIQAESSAEAVFIPVLNGSFMFCSDLCKQLDFIPEMQFIKVKSYDGMNTTGEVEELIGLNSDLTDKDVYIVEDIIDTGLTISNLYGKVRDLNPRSINIITFLYKPESYQGINLDLIVGYSIPNDFVVGYGMDFNEVGRSLKELYVISE